MIESIRFLNYEIEIKRRPRRRNITLCMHPYKKIQVRVNLKISHKQVIEFLLSHQAWIEKNLKKFQMLESQFVRPTMTEGSCYPFLGQLKYLQFSTTTGKHSFFKLEEGFLIYHRPHLENIRTDFSNEFYKKLHLFYKLEAEAYLNRKVKEWSDQTGLVPSKLKFRSHQARWGSCSSNQHIILNWKMICLSPVLIDYVIVHELCHLKHLNHSKEFWALVESFFSSYKESKQVLQKQEHFCRFLS